MTEGKRQYGRREHARALVANALTSPFALTLFVAILAVGVVVGASLGLSLLFAGALYAIAVGRTLLDEDVADRVLQRGRGDPKSRVKAQDVSLADLAPEIRGEVEAVREREARIRRAIESADLPYEEVDAEVDSFVAEAERSARSAQLLLEGLADMPVAEVRRRLTEAEGDSSQAELAEALREQLGVAERIESQLSEYHHQMERLCVELDTVRAHLLSTSVTAESASQRQLAAQVRGLREEMGAVASGIEQAYDEALI
jgi:ParB-like chromosome segregation protein Spo0J